MAHGRKVTWPTGQVNAVWTARRPGAQQAGPGEGCSRKPCGVIKQPTLLRAGTARSPDRANEFGYK
jgi:hypothetical protein